MSCEARSHVPVLSCTPYLHVDRLSNTMRYGTSGPTPESSWVLSPRCQLEGQSLDNPDRVKTTLVVVLQEVIRAGDRAAGRGAEDVTNTTNAAATRSTPGGGDRGRRILQRAERTARHHLRRCSMCKSANELGGNGALALTSTCEKSPYIRGEDRVIDTDSNRNRH